MKVMKIVPINGHLVVKPLARKSLLPTERGQFEEMGQVIELPATFCLAHLFARFFRIGILSTLSEYGHVEKGDTVLFDAWLVAKYQIGEGDDDIAWLVPFKDVRGIIKNGKDKVPE